MLKLAGTLVFIAVCLIGQSVFRERWVIAAAGLFGLVGFILAVISLSRDVPPRKEG